MSQGAIKGHLENQVINDFISHIVDTMYSLAERHTNTLALDCTATHGKLRSILKEQFFRAETASRLPFARRQEALPPGV